MATPQSATGRDGTTAEAKKFEQITFRFCSECSNMLYPKEDEDAHKLQFTCRTCQYTEDAQSSCVFRNVLNNSQGETAGVTQDVGSDPTVSDAPPVTCLLCGHAILCISCDQPGSHMLVRTPNTNTTPGLQRDDAAERKQPVRDGYTAGGDTLGLCLFKLSYFDCDPFAEYDEELMDDKPSDHDSDSPNSDSETGDEGCADGAMVIDL